MPENDDCCYLSHLFMRLIGAASGMAMLSSFLCASVGLALPPMDDTPEEILRTEIILDARSPVDGEPLTASEYVELQEDLATPDAPPTLSSETQQVIFLLQIRKFLNIISPIQIL